MLKVVDSMAKDPAAGRQHGAPRQTDYFGLRAARTRDALGRVPTWIFALAFYTVIAIVTIGRFAIGHPRTVCACVGTEDPAAYMWALSWWPHALVHGLNPFVTHYQWAPTGVNVAQAAMIPTAAIAMAPVTALAGPIFTYNLLSIASPVLSALTAYLLCRRVVGKELPAVAGGYLFGFSSYELGQLTGHLNLTLIFLIPVMVHVGLKRADREISRPTFVIAMTLLLVLQIGLSTELLAESVALGAALLLGARILTRKPVRARVDALILETLGAGLLAALAVSPFLYYALFSGSFPKGAPNLSDVYGLDLVNLIFPTEITWIGHHDFLALGLAFEQGHITEAGGYLSIAIAIAFVAWLIGLRRPSLLARLISVVVVLSLLGALGSHLHVAGYETIALPYNWVRNLPIFDDIVPSRMMLFTVLAVSVGVAAWLAAPGGWHVARWFVVLVGVVLTLPNMLSTLYGAPPHNPRFFSAGIYRHYLIRNETLLVLPFGHNDVSTLWQAESGFYFYMPEGYVSGVVPSPFDGQLTAEQLVANTPPPPPSLGVFIRQHYVSDVVVDSAAAGPWPGVLAQLGLHGRYIGGVILYAVPDAPV